MSEFPDSGDDDQEIRWFETQSATSTLTGPDRAKVISKLAGREVQLPGTEGTYKVTTGGDAAFLKHVVIGREISAIAMIRKTDGVIITANEPNENIDRILQAMDKVK